jgi:hypothetical protein
MSNLKNLFAKIKSEVKFAKTDEGHRLNEPSSSSSSSSQTEQTLPRQNFESRTVSRAAAEAAQQRIQNQLSRQQAGTSSENIFDI